MSGDAEQQQDTITRAILTRPLTEGAACEAARYAKRGDYVLARQACANVREWSDLPGVQVRGWSDDP